MGISRRILIVLSACAVAGALLWLARVPLGLYPDGPRPVLPGPLVNAAGSSQAKAVAARTQIDGTLRGRSGEPIVWATVRVMDSGARILSESISGRTGWFALVVPSGPVAATLELAAPGYRWRVVPLGPGGEEVRHLGVLPLEPSTVLRIAVIDRSKSPIGGIPIEARWQPGARRSPFVAVPFPVVLRKADATGVATFEGLPPGSWRFFNRDPRYLDDGTCELVLRDGMQDSFRLRLRARDRVVVRLLDELNRPVVGATVRRLYEGSGEVGEGESGVTVQDGCVSLYRPFTDRPSTLEVTLRDGAISTLAEGPHFDERRTWNVKTGIPESEVLSKSVRGRVLDVHDAGLRALVRAVSTGLASGQVVLETCSEEDGGFMLSGLPQDQYRIFAIPVSSDGMVQRLRGQAQVEVPGVPQDGVTIRLDVGMVITGVVLDDAGKPVPGLAIRAEGTAKPNPDAPTVPPRPGNLHTSCATDGKGRFWIDGLAEGTFFLTPSSGTANGDWPWLEGGEAVESMERGGRGIVLHAIPSPVLRGIALTVDGAPLGNVRVIATRLPWADHTCEFWSAMDGSFALPGRDPGAAYRVTACFDDGASSPSVEVAPGACEVRLVSEAQVCLSGVLLSSAKKPLRERRLVFRHKGSDAAFTILTDAHGVFRQSRVPPGEYDVYLYPASIPTDAAFATIHTDLEGQTVVLPESGGKAERSVNGK